MRGKRSLTAALLGGLCLALFSGCNFSAAKVQDVPEEKSGMESDGAAEVPKLAASGERLLDFVPEGWELLDSGELDFNQDGITDYVGVLEKSNPGLEEWWPRILFAVASNGEGRYELDFQDCNLIRTSDEGGINGDPYGPLSAERMFSL